MSLSRSWAVARTSWRLQMRDPAPIIAMTLLPLVLIAFLVQSAKAQLVLEGYPNASGADQVVPGFAVLFAFLSVEQVVSLFYREYAWGTWDRLRTTPASTADIVTGKVVVRFVVGPVQTTLVFVFGAALFGYLVFGDVPRWQTVVGAAIIIAAGLFIFFREQKLARGPALPEMPPEM